ncbi:DUF3501 family protein [Oceanibaculum nanhaiense]|jgi:hypothetical protein|uniref:DUF3501 family protein n=1 Tax=Oceanibaculum nanhaiense TaxID=1909734 RepID=UPI000A384448|nr:DUF3501 family protein [Oceanibaculum nanhaiense]
MMPAAAKQITHADILPLPDYVKVRKERRSAVVALKKNRRLPVGPHATFYFENFDTMLSQIQEMLYIEKGGDEQLEDELSAYNPLIPQGRELVATVMFEIDDEVRRRRVLSTLGGIEHQMFIKIGSETVKGVAEDDLDRTTADGKASSVQFVHFPFTEAQIAAFRKPGAEVVLGFSHENYPHMTVMPDAVREALAKDFD